MKHYRDMSEADKLAWGAAESDARKADLRDRRVEGLRTAQANAISRRKAIGATASQAADMVIRANREARRAAA